MRAGGRPAMVLVIGLVIGALYGMVAYIMDDPRPEQWVLALGFVLSLAAFTGTVVYITKRETRHREPHPMAREEGENRDRLPDEVEETQP